MQKTFFIALAALFLGPVCSGQTFTWQSLVEQASQKNPELRAASESMVKSEAQVRAAWGPFLPQISGTISYSHGNASSAAGNVPGGGGGSSPGTVFGVVTTTDQYSMALTASQNLFNGFQDQAKLSQARATLVASAAALRKLKAVVHQNLKKAYAQILFAQQTIELAAKTEKRRKDNFELVSLRFKGGRENRGSFLKSKAQWRLASFEVTQGRLALETAQEQLASLIAWPNAREIKVVGELRSKPVPTHLEQTQSLVEATPDVAQSAAELTVAEKGVQGAIGALLPSLALTGSLSKVGLSFPPQTNRWAIGLSMTIPLFKYGDWETISGAKAEARRAEFSLQNKKQQVAAQLRAALNKFRVSAEKVGVQSDMREAAETRSEIARAQYTAGIITYNEWDMIESDRIAQTQALLASRLDAVSAEAEWEQALGQGELQ